MTLASVYFFAHQPFRLRRAQDRNDAATIAPEDLERHFDRDLDAGIFRKVAANCYLPATRALRDMLRDHDGDKPFKVAFGLSRTFLEQALRDAPDVIDVLREVVATGRVEHSDAIESIFGVRTEIFRNTEMLYSANHAIPPTAHSKHVQSLRVSSRAVVPFRM